MFVKLLYPFLRLLIFRRIFKGELGIYKLQQFPRLQTINYSCSIQCFIYNLVPYAHIPYTYKL